nr:MAG TPA: hypothetical protein [Caudoviricetes sp.]
MMRITTHSTYRAACSGRTGSLKTSQGSLVTG